MDRGEHEYGTPTPGPRGETGQRDEINMNESNMNMMRMMMEYMKRQDRQIERLIQRLGENSDSLSNTTKDPIKDKVDEFCKDAKINPRALWARDLVESASNYRAGRAAPVDDYLSSSYLTNEAKGLRIAAPAEPMGQLP
ncbi:hypothetical protein ACO22_07539 [Paracoccidioides brasiliensis]|uniref:Uncharacterized protein n=1 Tax=Paracoccidioides brasiliensis TaxID=121759 RepID=A0A1D2J4E6_PARBR|nr:hypothetical protein ACO22_07539 [Paracoccidioides brasiliensis]